MGLMFVSKVEVDEVIKKVMVVYYLKKDGGKVGVIKDVDVVVFAFGVKGMKSVVFNFFVLVRMALEFSVVVLFGGIDVVVM